MSSLHCLGHMSQHTDEYPRAQAGACIAIGSRRVTGCGQPLERAESLHAAQRPTATAAGIEHLGEKGLEGEHGSEGAFTAVGSRWLLEVTQPVGKAAPKQSLKMPEAKRVELADLSCETKGFGEWFATQTGAIG